MSGYGDVEALWLARIRAISGYDADNTSRGDWGILNHGAAARYVILKPGDHTREMVSFSTRLETWQTVIEVWQRYKDDGQSLTDLETAVNTILDSVDQYPRLGDTGGTVRLGEVTAVREVVQVPADAPKWIMAALVGTVHEEKAISYQE